MSRISSRVPATQPQQPQRQPNIPRPAYNINTPWRVNQNLGSFSDRPTVPSPNPTVGGATQEAPSAPALNLPSLPRLGAHNQVHQPPAQSQPQATHAPGPIGPQAAGAAGSGPPPGINGVKPAQQHPTFAQVAQQGMQHHQKPQTSVSMPRLGGLKGQPAVQDTRQAADADRYGLKSLSGILGGANGSHHPLAGVAVGGDLRQAGLPLASEENLGRSFTSPWPETSKYNVIPDFVLPECYNIRNVVPQQQKLQSLNEETLFYIFYTMPSDAMQEAVAVELTNRNWRYHKELKLWLTKDPLSEPIQTGNRAESGIYIFFDPVSWEKVKKEYVLYYQDIA